MILSPSQIRGFEPATCDPLADSAGQFCYDKLLELTWKEKQRRKYQS
ncbi:Uncharacterized protein dnl_59520 [Desulfonema limicola]|uniref:Uncharacterized protein n=1 Tax=Desulfonema limicola TaxID=45656 RepID=A0A975BDA5_9BACT|nr:hypothetical protein [Desulfonema limicola]QTA83539.1 Uncharacterized protein dnl_59520 [Desulfonema limicola]